MCDKWLGREGLYSRGCRARLTRDYTMQFNVCRFNRFPRGIYRLSSRVNQITFT